MSLRCLFLALMTPIIASAVIFTLSMGQAAAQQQISLEALSDQGTFIVEMTWTPDDIGHDNTFSIRFIEPETSAELEDMEYDIMVYEESGSQELRRVDQTASEQRFSFEEPGSYTIRIDDIDGLGEGASFPIQVTPEFPAGVLGVVAGLMGAIAILARRNSNNLFRF
ncbi:MAG TPA: hypothetical protein VIB07_09775 [Nitrososphaera sp.]